MSTEFIHPRQLNRRSGRSTREIDQMVQELFTNGKVYIMDHAHDEDAQGRPLNLALKFTRKTLLTRLRMEHGLQLGGKLSEKEGHLILTTHK